MGRFSEKHQIVSGVIEAKKWEKHQMVSGVIEAKKWEKHQMVSGVIEAKKWEKHQMVSGVIEAKNGKSTKWFHAVMYEYPKSTKRFHGKAPFGFSLMLIVFLEKHQIVSSRKGLFPKKHRLVSMKCSGAFGKAPKGFTEKHRLVSPSAFVILVKAPNGFR